MTKKRILAFLLCCAMILGDASFAFAAQATPAENAWGGYQLRKVQTMN